MASERVLRAGGGWVSGERELWGAYALYPKPLPDCPRCGRTVACGVELWAGTAGVGWVAGERVLAWGAGDVGWMAGGWHG